ncbi:MAG: FAD-dependent oxidoreductase [Acidobacteriia bacterium]|nr:FAD-dependent oxidoreductase [Terriglobia bacterium]
MARKLHVAVVGAGAFGGWAALSSLRRGARVTLVDAWGPGNSRASSGGETRIVRGTYGPSQPYTRMTARAMQLWSEHEKQWGRQLLHRTGVLWMATAGDDQFERASLPLLREAGISYEELSAGEMARRWQQINFEGVRWGIYEPDSGFLKARVACQAVVEGFVREGGEYRQAAVVPQVSETSYRGGLNLSDGTQLLADKYVFACGPWLGRLFPEAIGNLIRVTKQDVFFFGPPAGDGRFSEAKLPVWADHRDRFLYGTPAHDGRGFKIADDTRGREFDPTSGERNVSAESLKTVSEYLGFRFPGMKDAPLVETRVCQYENTPDNHFIIDRHPVAEKVWIVGGGSGHGFKHGPVVGEMVAGWVMEEKNADPLFRLSRFEQNKLQGMSS